MTITSAADSNDAAGPAPQSLRHYPDGPAEIVEASGALDVCGAEPLRALLYGLVAGRGRVHVVVDLHRVTFLGAAGLGALIAGWKHTRDHGGSFAVACTDRHFLRILRITGLTAALGVCASVSQALGNVPLPQNGPGQLPGA